MKAVIPAAGLGTRLLPATKSMPKEMLPVIDRPVIQYVVEEAVASGCDEILIITGRGKRSIEDHFDIGFELEHHLEATGKTELRDRVRQVSELARIHYVRQPEPKGLGDAILCAEDFVGDQPFLVLLGDDIVTGTPRPLDQMLDVHKATGDPVLSVMRVPDDHVSRYGIIDPVPLDGKPGAYEVQRFVEKPPMDEAPSNLASIGRYVLDPSIFDHLRATPVGHGGELQLTDAMARMLDQDRLLATEFQGRRLDVGTVAGFVLANVALALEREDLADRIRAMVDEHRTG